MNIYFLGMVVSMSIYIIIGIIVSRSIKNEADFYVAGRAAPIIFTAGSLIASYASTGLFMGDAQQFYDGVFGPVIIVEGMQVAGYLVGAALFGRYLRRSETLTIPEYFGSRFASKKMRYLASFTALIMMSVYLLSVTQGVGTLMNAVTGVDYKICIIMVVVVCIIITSISGSKGVLVTDTIMAVIFTLALIVSAFVISAKTGGWYASIGKIASNPQTVQYLSWHGKRGVLYESNRDNIIWGINYGIVWMSVCAVAPWQSSRYMMAKDENTILGSASIAAIGVFLLEFLVGLVAVMINNINFQMEDSSRVFIWAAMNMLPVLLGVILLTGVLGAGVSSATTFLSLIGASFSKDIIEAQGKGSITVGRIAMLVVGIVIIILAISNPPSIFWIMYMGGAMAASSWMPVAFASIFSKRLTKTGAFCGMLFGFLGSFAVKMYTVFTGSNLPVYLDQSIVGMVLNVLAMFIGSAFTKVSEEEKQAREKLFIIPEKERDAITIKSSIAWAKFAMFVGLAVFLIMFFLWVVPYNIGLH